MRRLIASSCLLLFGALSYAAAQSFRPPAAPLVACDPYFSIWSNADRLTDDHTRHWTKKPHRLTSRIRIDQRAYRLMGSDPQEMPALDQTELRVLPTRTIYDFEGGGVHVTLTFTTPALPDDLALLSRPVTYLAWDISAIDGKRHKVAVQFDAAPEVAVYDAEQPVAWSRVKADGLAALRVGSEDQPVLDRKGDDTRIDWGYFYVAAPRAERPRTAFLTGPHSAPAAGQRPAKDAPLLAVSFDLGRVGAQPISRWLMLAYDDTYSIQYFGQNLRAYWRKDGMDGMGLLERAAADYEALVKRCRAFDEELTADAAKIGGEKYARICALAYRQALAGNKLAADPNGQPLLFPKENTSNGCIATVDVIYPMAPQFLLFGPALSRAMLAHILEYSSSERWKFPFAPHDLGTYPKANGQVYGGGERTEVNQMPVEETGNMLILLAALARMEGNAEFASRYWPVVSKWAEFLKEKGFDPENQLCTDDFAGHLAHNVNLSAKAIIGLASYAQLCEMRGERQTAAAYRALAQEFAARWVKEADDGDHFRLAFDQPATWSQKYNLVWDRILGFELFPEEVLRKEMDFYRKNLNRYGLPLDNRKTYAKLDWSLWTATLTGRQDDFEALAWPVYDFLNDTPQRVPMNDLYWTENAEERGMHARPVVGGVFLRMLYEPALWKKWAAKGSGGAAAAGLYAPVPPPPVITPIVPAAEKDPVIWRYTTAAPAPGTHWFTLGYDDSSWQEGPAGFGAGNIRNSVIRTPWKTSDIWLRREVVLPQASFQDLQLWIHHDEDVEIYVNGVLAATASGFLRQYEALPIKAAAKAALKPGQNLIAIHCHQTVGGQYIDLGLVEVRPK